jgi:hypothetical protein
MCDLTTTEFFEDPFAAEERTFLQKRRQLLQRYEGQFVALYQGRVVGHGLDDEELAREMFEQFGKGLSSRLSDVLPLTAGMCCWDAVY